MLAPPQEPMRKKGKALIGQRACPCFLSPTASLSLVPSDECSMHQNLPSSEQGPAKKKENSIRSKNYHPPSGHIDSGHIEGRVTFPPQPYKSVRQSPSTEQRDYTVPRLLDLHSTIWPQGTSSSVSLLTRFHLARSHLCPPCLKLLRQCCCRKREQLLNRLGSPLKWL